MRGEGASERVRKCVSNYKRFREMAQYCSWDIDNSQSTFIW